MTCCASAATAKPYFVMRWLSMAVIFSPRLQLWLMVLHNQSCLWYVYIVLICIANFHFFYSTVLFLINMMYLIILQRASFSKQPSSDSGSSSVLINDTLNGIAKQENEVHAYACSDMFSNHLVATLVIYYSLRPYIQILTNLRHPFMDGGTTIFLGGSRC
jgi:hypothetical protein